MGGQQVFGKLGAMEDKERGVVVIGIGNGGLGRYYCGLLGHIDPGVTTVTECSVPHKVTPKFDFDDLMPKPIDFPIIASRQQRRKLERAKEKSVSKENLRTQNKRGNSGMEQY